jgi:hypothetical protein
MVENEKYIKKKKKKKKKQWDNKNEDLNYKIA